MKCEDEGMFQTACTDDVELMHDPAALEMHGEENLVVLCSAHKYQRERDV